MTRLRLPFLLLSSLLVWAGCAYESSGTTTTTTVAEDGVPPPTSPASILFEDQRIEGSAVVVQSLTLPATGFVVLQDAAGDLIGLSEVIGPGRIDAVPVPFFVPLAADTAVSAALHIDMEGPNVTPFPPDVREKLEVMKAAHAALPTPARLGRSIGIRRKSKV